MMRTWRRRSSTASSSAAESSHSTGPRCEPNISALTTRPRLRHYINRPEFPELTRQNFRNPHQQNSVRVQQVSCSDFLTDRRPHISSERMVTPGLSVSPQVGVPGHTHPIELEALNLEFSRGILQVIARSCIVPIVQKPLNRIDIHAN